MGRNCPGRRYCTVPLVGKFSTFTCLSVPSIGRQPFSGRRAPGAPQRNLFPLPPGGPWNTCRQMSLKAESSLLALSSASDVHWTRFLFFPLPGHPSLIGLLSVQESIHTCPRVGLCGFELWVSESPSGLSRGAVLAAALQGCLDSPQSQPAPAPGDAPNAGLRYLALVHLPQVPEDVQAGRGEMRPHGASAHHGRVLGPRGPADSGCHRKLPGTGRAPAHRPRVFAGHLTGDSLRRLGMVVSATGVPGKNAEEEDYHSQNAAGREPRPVRTQGA